MAAPKRRRLDDELVAQGYFADRSAAMRAVMAGEVSSRGERLTHPGHPVAPGAPLHVKVPRTRSARGRGTYVGRGGLKLEGALSVFGLDPAGMNCLDVGCSTGGFTDCLLKFGARRVAAVDVGRGQFDWALRGDVRVALFERTNICAADPVELGAPFDLAVADVSFTSVGVILHAVHGLLGRGGLFCTLVKPQFEAAREKVDPGGVVRDPAVHEDVLRRVAGQLGEGGLAVRAACVSPVRGAKGNIEYFLLAARDGRPCAVDLAQVVRDAWDAAVPEACGDCEEGGHS